jgi:hypothetical protein
MSGRVLELHGNNPIVRDILAFNQGDTSDFGNDLYLL